jgi:hypothetical protein
MRIPDVLLMACVLVLAPASAWIYGRFAGRRDWKMLAVLGGAVLITSLALLAMAALRTPPVGAAARAAPLPLAEAATSAEFGAFVMIFACLVAMLGWSSVPVAVGKS